MPVGQKLGYKFIGKPNRFLGLENTIICEDTIFVSEVLPVACISPDGIGSISFPHMYVQ